jgi:hypothetical protein
VHGQENSKTATFAGLAVDVNAAAMTGDDAVRNRQAQAGSFADRLGSKERIE